MELTRRDFLKLFSVSCAYTILPNAAPQNIHAQAAPQPNILIIVFDAFTATHMSLYGYSRATTPNIARLAERATVYHEHFAGGHWTYPGTSSLLTGVLPWSHRGFNRGQDMAEPFSTDNIFGYFDDYFRMAYTHNSVSDEVLNKVKGPIDQYYPRKTLYIHKSYLLNEILKNDFDIATVSKRRITQKTEEGYASSLFLSHLTEFFRKIRERELNEIFDVPPEVSGSGELFMLEDATDWTVQQVKEMPRPFLSYIHMFPPHEPYVVRKDFASRFVNDDFQPIQKPDHFFTAIQKSSVKKTEAFRLAYNQAILYVDEEFGRLMDQMEQDGSLENTWVILTSDHGEMFERGLTEHIRPVFYQSGIKVPLMIFQPGQTQRQDIYTPTVGTDLLPTLLHLAGKPIPSILEGSVLPPFAEAQPERSIYAVDARENDPLKPLSTYTAMIRKGPYKLTYYAGYDQLPGGEPYTELYNLDADPDELDDLSAKELQVRDALHKELFEKIDEKDQPYR